MNHTAIAKTLCGRYVRLGEHHGFLESSFTVPRDGTLLGVYLFEAEGGRVRATDDGDTLFHAAVAGADIKKARAMKYRAIASECGVELTDQGELVASFEEGEAPFRIPRFFEAAHRIVVASLDHRPKVAERFELAIGAALDSVMPDRVTRRHVVTGASGHQLRFPFALDATGDSPILIQPLAADEGRVDWAHVYQAGGKFRDVMNAGIQGRRIAVIEPADARQIAQARVALGDAADVLLYESPGQLAIALPRAA